MAHQIIHWTDVLEVRPSNLRLLVISNRANSVRVIALVLCSVVIPALGFFVAWQLLNAYFSEPYPVGNILLGLYPLSPSSYVPVVLWNSGDAVLIGLSNAGHTSSSFL